MLLSGAAYAQKPSIGFVYPAGAQRGESLEVTVGGMNIAACTEAIISGKGVKAELIIDNSEEGRARNKISKKGLSDEANLQIAQRMKVRITVDTDAEPGMRDIRLSSSKGISNRLLFEVGQFKGYSEQEPNSVFSKANTIQTLPCTINGQIMMSDIDCYRFHAKRGHTYVMDVKARRFVPYMADAVPGWFQPTLTVRDSSGKEVAYSDDWRYRVDPLILFEAPHDGEYTLEIQDALFRGREDFTYRIDLGEIPYITGISPLGGPAGKITNVTLSGVNLPKQTLQIRPKASQEGRQEMYISSGNIRSNTFSFDVNRSLDEAIRAPKRNAQRIESDMVINGCFREAYEQHLFVMEVPKRTVMLLDVRARRLGSPADVKIDIMQGGKKLASEDDTEDQTEAMMTHMADPQMVYRFKEPGVYTIRLTETLGAFGPDYQYRLYVTQKPTDFEMMVEPATISIPRGGSTVANLSIVRKYRSNVDVDVKVNGLPGGFTHSELGFEKGEKKRTFTISAPMGAKEGDLKIDISGKATDPKSGQTISRHAKPVEELTQAFAWSHLLPTDEFLVRILPPQPFSVKAELAKSEAKYHPGERIPIEVSLERRNGYSEPVVVMVRGAKNGGQVEADPITLGPGDKKGTIYVKFNRWRKSELRAVIIQGVVKPDGKRMKLKGKIQGFSANVTATAPAVLIRMPETKPEKRI